MTENPGIVNRERWTEDAACRGKWEEFDDHYPRTNEAYAAAKAICQQCPVIAECLSYAKRTHVVGGIWGGKIFGVTRTPHHSRKPVTHGTDNGYVWHMRRGLEPCESCVVAHKEAVARRRERRRATREAS